MIVLDAAGTLVELAVGVGEAYADAARAAGAEIDPDALGRGFARAHAAARPLAFGALDRWEREAAERAWWRDVARAAVESAGADPAGFDFARFFDLAWARFAEPDAWRVPPDVRPALRALRGDGVALGVLSNWDSRLPALLARLGLAGFFARIVVSAELERAKPDPAAFSAARAAFGEAAGSSPPLMVGDRIDHDVEPALEAGWDAVWLDRGGRGGPPPEGVRRIEDLGALFAPAGSRA